MTIEEQQILDELDSLYGELKRDARIGDVNPESIAKTFIEVMKLFGRYIARSSHRIDLPPVARNE